VKRSVIIAVLLGAGLSTGGYFLYQSRLRRVKSATRRHQESILRLYREILPQDRARTDELLNGAAPGWQSQVQAFSASDSVELSTELTLRMQVAVQPQLKPVPILDGRLQPLLTQPPLDEAPVLTEAQTNRILTRAQSVGRIEVKNGLQYSLVATGFVIRAGLVATNCHVVQQVAAPVGTAGSFVLNPSGTLLIDFGDGPTHDPGNEFQIRSLRPCPGTGLDVAFMETDAASIDSLHPMPPPLALVVSAPTLPSFPHEFDVGGIG
jgi:hypothetical protein